ncbi:MAG: hypothetical protein EZS28_037427, partial [Streblomastix strix]
PYLLTEALHKIDFHPTLDAFALRTNKQLDRYCSPQRDRKAFAINAMNIPWRGEEFLLYPPIGLIYKVIQKLIRDKAAAFIIPLRWCLYNYRSMIPQILSQVTLGRSEQVLIRGKFMKKEQNLPPETIELIKISTIYQKEKGISVKDLLGIIPDIELVNALAWYKSRGGPKLQKRMKNMKMHHGVVLSQFSQMNDENNSLLIKTFSKGEGLHIYSKPMYPIIWNLQILFSYINTHQSSTLEEILQTAMTMIVAFCATRLTEFVQMKFSKIVQELHSITFQTHTSKGKQIIKHIITFKKRIGRFQFQHVLN